MQNPTVQYEYVIENEEWLEDDGNCSRYYDEESGATEWVCHKCCEVIDDPSEHECEAS